MHPAYPTASHRHRGASVNALVAAEIANNQIIYQYCDADGNITDAANPNGTMHNIAGVCNSARNVFGMMPHPERACSIKLANTDGKTVFNTLFLQHVQQAVLA
jgi:phosphoribosylformylglycinamidine synthase